MSLLDKLKWRYATKRMNGEKLPADKLENILEAIRLSPSSLGLQPYNIIVVGDTEKRREIFEKACDQPQVIESSHLLVFASKDSISDSEIGEHITRIASERQVSEESLRGLRENIRGFAARKQQIQGDYLSWSARQAYIALGIGITAAADESVDATPMEGFNPDAMDEVLGLKVRGLHSQVLLALGYRDETKDWLARAKKVRKPGEMLFTRIS